MKPIREIPRGTIDPVPVLAVRLNEAEELMAKIKAKLRDSYTNRPINQVNWLAVGDVVYAVQKLEELADFLNCR